MNGQSIFKLRCGTASQATRVADWLECEHWPDDLRSLMEMTFGNLDKVVSLVFTASAEGRQVLVQATGPSSPEMVMVVLDYAMQSWSSVPSPQGFVFGCVRGPEIDPTTYENIGMGEFDGGAVLLRRGAEPSVMTASDWLKAALQSVGPA